MTVICVLVACLFPGAGYDTVLATAFGLPGPGRKPGTEGPVRQRVLPGQEAARRAGMKRGFELDAAVADAELGIGLLWKGLEVTALDGTTMELGRNGVLEGEFGIPADGARPLLRVTAHVRTATFRWIGAAVGGYHDGENALADQLEGSFRPGMLNLADRGFFSMHRWIRFSGTGAELAWRIKNGAKSVPLKTLRTLPDGSELVMLHESDGMRTRRRRDTQNPQAERLPDTIARLVTFTVTAATRSGRTKTTMMRVLTTLLDHKVCPAREIAVLYAERWQIEIAFLHLKRTVRGPRRAAARPVPGTGPPGSLGAAAHPQHHRHRCRPRRRTRRARPRPHPVHRRPRPHPRPRRRRGTCCRHCGHRPPTARWPAWTPAILALPRHRPGRQRTSGSTTAERRTRHTEEVTYTIDDHTVKSPEMGVLTELAMPG